MRLLPLRKLGKVQLKLVGKADAWMARIRGHIAVVVRGKLREHLIAEDVDAHDPGNPHVCHALPQLLSEAAPV